MSPRYADVPSETRAWLVARAHLLAFCTPPVGCLPSPCIALAAVSIIPPPVSDCCWYGSPARSSSTAFQPHCSHAPLTALCSRPATFLHLLTRAQRPLDRLQANVNITPPCSIQPARGAPPQSALSLDSSSSSCPESSHTLCYASGMAGAATTLPQP